MKGCGIIGRKLSNVKILSLTLLTLASSSAIATNGYFSHGYGTVSKGIAGAGSASSSEVMVIATNPAGLAGQKTQFSMGGALFTPERGYENRRGAQFPQPTTYPVDSHKEWYMIPHMAFAYQLDDKSTIGAAMYGNGGMNSTYRNKDYPAGQGLFGAASKGAGVDMMQLFMNFAYARKVNDNLSVGAGLVYAWQRFSARGFLPFGLFVYDKTCGVSQNYCLSDLGNDYANGTGLRVGLQYQPSDMLSIGIGYATEMRMTKFQRYKNLFAQGGGFNIPRNGTIGFTLKPNSKLKLHYDVQKIWFHDTRSVGNSMDSDGSMASIFACTANPAPAYCLGGPDGIGFGWSNMVIHKVGAEWKYAKDLTLRFGYSNTNQPIQNDDVLFNTVAPAVIEEHFTVGFTKQMSKDNELNFAMFYAPNNPVIGDAGGPGGAFTAFQGGNDAIEIYMDQFEVEMAWTWKF